MTWVLLIVMPNTCTYLSTNDWFMCHQLPSEKGLQTLVRKAQNVNVGVVLVFVLY